jgi:hypothetical protein
MGKLKPTDSRVVVESVQPTVDGGRFPSSDRDPVVVAPRSSPTPRQHHRHASGAKRVVNQESRGNDWTAETRRRAG